MPEAGFHGFPGATIRRRGGGAGLQSYSPAWTSSGTAPAIGNGSLTGQYLIPSAGVVIVFVHMVLGSTSTVGTGSYRWSLPSIGTYVSRYQGGTAGMRDNSSTQRGFGICEVSVGGPSSPTFAVRVTNVSINASEWSATVPVVPAAADTYDFMLTLTYT